MIGLLFGLAVTATTVPPSLTPSEVRQIRRTCHLPSSYLRYRRDQAVQIKVPGHASTERIDCMLTELRKRAHIVGEFTYN